jgi:hypothetical protein
MKILAHEVDSIEEFCGLPLSSQKVWEMQLEKEDSGLLRSLRETFQPAREAIVPPSNKVTQNTRHTGFPAWKILELETCFGIRRQRTKPRRPDMIAGLKDWEHMRVF